MKTIQDYSNRPKRYNKVTLHPQLVPKYIKLQVPSGIAKEVRKEIQPIIKELTFKLKEAIKSQQEEDI